MSTDKCGACRYYAGPADEDKLGYCERHESPVFADWPVEHWQDCGDWEKREENTHGVR